MTVEEDVYGSARRDVPASICIVLYDFVFTFESLLYLEESFERKKITRICVSEKSDVTMFFFAFLHNSPKNPRACNLHVTKY